MHEGALEPIIAIFLIIYSLVEGFYKIELDLFKSRLNLTKSLNLLRLLKPIKL